MICTRGQTAIFSCTSLQALTELHHPFYSLGNFCKLLYCGSTILSRGGYSIYSTVIMVKLLKVPFVFLIVASSYGQEGCHCPSVAYLHLGGKGTISCRCDHFSLVSWYSSKEVYDDGDSPFITYDNSQTRGDGKESGQYNVELDGSLIINNVSIVNHEMEYFCVFLRDTETVRKRVRVEVIVPPDPLYPVLNGQRNHQNLYLDMKRQGVLYCSMKGVHPKVNLSITIIDQGQRGGVYLERGEIRYSPNGDNTYDVNVGYNYTADLSVQTSVFQCEVTGELGEHFSELTTAEISFPPAYPVIDGGFDPEHIYLKKNRTGEIKCSIKTSDPEATLVWKVVDPFSKDKITFNNCMLRTLPTGDIFTVSLKCSYVVEDEDVDRLTVQCQVAGSTDEQYQNATEVELSFPRKDQILSEPTSLAPVIDGCNGKHEFCMLKVQSEGELTCRLKNTHQSVELRWNVFDGHQWKEVLPQNMEVAEEVISTFPYEVKKPQATMIVECYTVVGDRIPGTSCKVVLVTEGDGESDNKSEYGALIGLILLTFLVIIILLIEIYQSYFIRKMYKVFEQDPVMEGQCSTPPGGRRHSVYFNEEGAKKDKASDSPDSGNPGNSPRIRRRVNTYEMRPLVEDSQMSNGSGN